MVAAINTGKAYTGFRPALDLSASILDPQALFASYKSRVLADGGHIPDESGCIERFKFLLLNAMFERTVVSLTPAFGIKTDSAGNVLTVYNLLGEAGDLLAVSKGTPPGPMLYDTSTRSINVQITSNGGTWLQSRGSIVMQKAATYLLAGCMSDSSRADGNGLTFGYPIGSLPMAYMRTMITNNQAITESWRFGTRDSGWPADVGGALMVAATLYEDYVPAAGLFDVTSGVITGYEKGKFAMKTTSSTGALADLRDRTAALVVGTPGSTTTGCYGTFRDMLHLHSASEADAVLASRLGI
ncbi:hypothetical protein [Serratia marcescens]|uniref:hypothetical protein n=1 Tax=Serratia marcescens TaxID=615 RepID=UPI0018828507|nr:hypothetical protein [Serratia marcescens]MBE8814792.1 hypothetical protein [Serratia marcescens]HEJ9179975.1 hypothetical protein [Serratia marcescens]